MATHRQTTYRCGLLLSLIAAMLLPCPSPAQVIEQEDPVKRRPRVIPVDDDGEVPAPKNSDDDAVDLRVAARQATQAAVKKLYDELKVPHDRIVQRNGRTEFVEPIAVYVGSDPKQATPRMRVVTLDARDWTSRGPTEIPAGAVQQVEAYEEIALKRVDEFLNDTRLQGSGDELLTRSQALPHGVAALSAVLRYHEGARRSRQRDGDAWNVVETLLRTRLLSLQLDRVADLWADKKYADGVALARRLLDRFGHPAEVKAAQAQLARELDKIYRGECSDEEARSILRVIGQLERCLPAGKSEELTRPIHDRFRRQAATHFAQAKALVQENKPREAFAELDEARKLCPELPGLEDYLLEQQHAYPILKVGVRELPRNFIPGLACTDSEVQAAELLFESLVRPVHDSNGDQSYVPALSLSRPRTLRLARQFELPRDGRWSNDQPIDFDDLANTISLLRQPRWPGYRPSLAKMIHAVERGTEAGQAIVSFEQDTFDPLALMTFKILPRDLKAADKLTFNSAPRGTGPYQLVAPNGGKDRDQILRFITNPGFSSRAAKRGRPFFREIHFVVTTDPARDLADGKIDLCLDVPSNKLPQALTPSAQTHLLPTASNRRVYFLAVNHRYGSALPSTEFRCALAAAIDREVLLDVFRPGKDGEAVAGLPKQLHQALTSVYPSGSWASPRADDRPKRDRLHDLRTVKDCLLQAEKIGLHKVSLTLKYPADDPRVAEAMKLLCKQADQAVAAAHTTVELELKPVAVESHTLREDVEEKFDYDLAFYHYDFDTDLYSAWPLFDPDPRAREAGGGNYLGYHNNAQMEALFARTMTRRDFQDVQSATRALAELMEKNMPIIPLWQLDRHVVARKDLRVPGMVDPVHVLAGVEEWRR